MIAVLTTLELMESVDPSLYFILSFIGFLVLIELTSPNYVKLRWRRRLIPVVIIGFIVFLVIAVNTLLPAI